ncbi:MAG TPA: FAD-dependent oxidoreductase [Lacunisphaera sp.]|nr:FAD-dependent oxidoreductase [Lacunisphaera sp.]
MSPSPSPDSGPKTVLAPAAQLPVLTEVDVLVIGAGTAGFVAAIGAARAGARTALVESNGFVGGANTATYNTGPGWSGDSERHQIIGGPGWEFLERMERAGHAIINRETKRSQIFPEATKEVALEMVVEAGVELYLHTWAGEVLRDGGRITGLVVQSKSGRQAILAKTFVDCSADGDIAARAGAPFERLEPADPKNWEVSIDLTVCNVDPVRVIRWAKANRHLLSDGGKTLPDSDDCTGIKLGVAINIRAGQTVPHSVRKFGRIGRELRGHEHVGTQPTLKLLIRRSVTRVQGNVTVDPTNVRDLTRAEVEGRRKAYQHLAYLKQTIDGMQDAFIVAQNPLGVRVARRIRGEYYITIDNLVENTRLPDVVSLNARSLDMHMPGERFQIHFLEGNHDVPYRALVPLNVENLLVAGRCLSCDHTSHASLRGAATCWGTGHAAGTAAALAARGSGRTREVNIRQLQNELLRQKAILTTAGRTFDEEVNLTWTGRTDPANHPA